MIGCRVGFHPQVVLRSSQPVLDDHQHPNVHVPFTLTENCAFALPTDPEVQSHEVFKANNIRRLIETYRYLNE